MNRKLFFAGSFGAICVAGILTGHVLSELVSCRNALGLLFGRGELLALVKGEGFYEKDLLRAVGEKRYLSGSDETTNSLPELRPALSGLIANAALGYEARKEIIPRSAIDREYELLQAQLRDKTTWREALRRQRLPAGSVRAEIANNLRSERLIEQQLVAQIKVTTERCREYYDANQADYILPVAFRARHLFQAAPPDTPPDVVDAKNRAIEMLATRLAHGEDFAELARLCSEDEATKTRGGDLGSFSEHRMPSDFIAALKNLPVGEMGPIVRTGLGFHIIQLLEIKGSRQMTFDEAGPEISLMMENERRRQACAEIAARLSNRANFVRLPSRIE